nr:zinc finger, CCHC-type [Tanacetum cinerariifolium]
VAKHKNAKDVWESIKVWYIRAKRVQKARLQILRNELEMLKMNDNESINDFSSKISGIVAKIKSLSSTLEEERRCGRVKASEERLQSLEAKDEEQGKLLLAIEQKHGDNSGRRRGRGRNFNRGGREPHGSYLVCGKKEKTECLLCTDAMKDESKQAYGHWDAITEDEVDEKKNYTTKGIIFQTLPENVLLQVTKHKNAKDVWESIKRFEELKLIKKGFKVLKQRMKSKVNSCWQLNKSMEKIVDVEETLTEVEEFEEEEEDVVTKVESDAMIVESLGILAMSAQSGTTKITKPT